MHLWMLALLLAPAEFRDDFDAVRVDPRGEHGWRLMVGDGAATMTLRPGRGQASVEVDATRDRRGIWWALMERSAPLRLRPGQEVRIEARLRASHAPRRVNLQVLTDKSTDDYAHLMEFDLADTDWHVISMTTRGFRLAPGETPIAHLALMDWGLERYHVDLDYLRLIAVDPARAGPDRGEPVPYHPPPADPRRFREVVPPIEDGMLDLHETFVNLGDWSVTVGGRRMRALTVDSGHVVILRWDLGRFAGRTVAGAGLLELTTQSLQRKDARVKDFGLIRVVEILGGDPRWDRNTVTADSFFRGAPPSQVLNPQMIIDWPVTEGSGGKTYLTIPRPVLQRLVDGKTLGIAIKPLGAISAAFRSLDGPDGPRLRFDLHPGR